MKGMMKRLGRVLMLALAVVLALNSGLLSVRAYAERGPEEYVFTDYGKMYDLESFLNGYNVLSFGNTYLGLHCIGALLVQGNYDGAGSNSGFADGENMPPSYIKGHLNAPNSVYNSRNHQVDPLYVGSSNTVTTSEGWGVRYYSVNGLGTGNNSTTPVYVSDNFFNFAQAYAVVKQAQTSMQRGSTVVEPDADGVVTVPLGSNVTIRSMEGVRVVNLTGDLDAKASTTINILEKGDVAIERQFVNGKYPAVVEQAEEGVSIVWNFPNAQSVLIPTQNWLGHIIAPDADVAQASGNYNGCIICNNLYSSAEGHLYNYTADETSWSTVYSVHKVWDDGNNADGIRPDSIRVQLLANGKPHGKPVTLRAADGWYHLWDKLPETDPKGNEIVYSVQEVDVPKGYEASYDPDTQTLVNTHEYETVDISGTKTWLNEWGWSRPWNITVRLFANGREVASQQINTSYWGGTNRYTFKDLPKYENGKEIVYTIHEDPVPGYIGEVDGYDLINTFGVEPISISGVKVWDDGNDADGLRPTEVVIQLLANGEVIEEHYAAANTGWTFTFANLPEKDENMQPITYTVREKETPEGYTGEVDGYTITNRHEPETTTVSGAKTWMDDNNNDGKRPESITVILLANMREVARKTVTAADGWKWTFEDLPKNDGGQPIRYTVTELAVEGYTSQADGMNLINTHENETTEVRGEKTWEDNENAAGGRPASITIRVWDGNREVASRHVTEADNWAWAFTDLPKYRSGKEIAYAITEDAVFGYETSVEGFDVINTYTVESVEVSGAKTWNDASNQDGKRPASITINLLADGKQVASKTVTAADNWAWSFTDLPKYADGQEIAYTISEEAVPGYTAEISGYNVINTYAPEKTSVSGAKTWNDADNQDGKRPASITINLLADGKQVASKTVTAVDNWAWSFTDLPKYADGQEIVYTITEEAVPGYTAEISGYNVTNTYAPEKTSVSGAKTWNDANNQDGKRPASITINLLADGKQVASKTVTAADNWAWSFTDLPKYADGQEIVYTITEEAVPGYTAEISGYDVINTYAPEKTSVSGAKTWNDVSNQDGKRPASITINLLADGKQVASKTVTAADNWAWSFTDLPKYADGQEIAYTITEEAVPGYTAEISGYDVINTYAPEKTSVSGAKTWNDASNQDGKRPARITITLLADGKQVASKTVTAADNWAWSFTDLPKYTDGQEIVYTITEEAVPGYTAEISGYDVINTYAPEKTSVSGAKTWNDVSNQDGKRPASITITLLADGKQVASKTVTAADNWAWSFTDLPKYADGQEIVYTITEEAVPGYTAEISGYDVINTYAPEKTSVSGAKTWNDVSNQDGKRPASITITLLADGKQVASKTVTAVDNWAWSFTDLPKYADGQEIVYTITEEAVPGYTSEVTGYDVTNTYAPEKTTVSGAKTWNDADNQDGKRPASITITLLADGKQVASKTVTAVDNWAWSFTDLPKYADGQEIAYTISEEAVSGYTSEVTGYNVINTYAPEKTSVSGAKTWNDASNQDGKRPASITINLLADGKQVASKTVTAVDNWAWSFTDLPKFANGEEIVYTISEAPVAGYTAEINGFNVTNTYQPEFVTVSGSKTWRDDGNRDGLRPASITIRLLADGKEIDRKVVTAAEGWAWQFVNLPRYADGREIAYTITEDTVPGYTTLIADYDVINTHLTEDTSISGRKLWFDDDDAYGVRPASVTVHLLANGRRVATRTVTAADGWMWTFDNLPVNENGNPIVYTLEEDPVPDYATFILGYNILNSYDRTSFAVTKIWEGPEGGDIRLTLYADGKRISPQPEYRREGSMYIWDDLPVFNAEGEEIEYSATEQYMDGYMTIYENFGPYAGETDRVYDGGTIINRGVVNVFVRKVWAGYDETMPKPEIQLVVYCNGDKTDIPMPEPDKHGWYKYYNLPAEVNGEPARYTVVETKMNGFLAVYTGVNGEPTDEGVHGGTITNVAVPATGDTEPLALWTALLLTSAAALLLLRRRRAA